MYIYVCSSVYIYASLYVCVGTHFCLNKSYLFNCLSCRYLGCYLLVWHCYLCSILAFSFEIVNLNTTTCTKSSTQVIKINLGKMNSLFPTLIVNNSGCIYLFIWINSDWLTDWLIDWSIDWLIIWHIYCAHPYLSHWEGTVFSFFCLFVCLYDFFLFLCFFVFVLFMKAEGKKHPLEVLL